MSYWFVVESNDTLYGSDGRFLGEVDTVGSTVLGEILAHLQELSEGFEVIPHTNLLLRCTSTRV